MSRLKSRFKGLQANVEEPKPRFSNMKLYLFIDSHILQPKSELHLNSNVFKFHLNKPTFNYMHTFIHVISFTLLFAIYILYNPLYKSKHPPASNFLHTQLPRCTLPFTGIKVTTQPHAAPLPFTGIKVTTASRCTTATHWLPPHQFTGFPTASCCATYHSLVTFTSAPLHGLLYYNWPNYILWCQENISLVLVYWNGLTFCLLKNVGRNTIDHIRTTLNSLA